MSSLSTASQIGKILFWLWKRVIKKQKIKYKDVGFEVSEWKRILVGYIFAAVFIVCLGIILDKCGD